jgi:hypothetical protein
MDDQDRPELRDPVAPAFRSHSGYTFLMNGANVAKLRELPGARGRTDDELAAEFFDGQAPRWVDQLSGDLPAPAELHVVIDPYSRQSFLARHGKIITILSF